jgi:hypothetical protein
MLHDTIGGIATSAFFATSAFLLSHSCSLLFHSWSSSSAAVLAAAAAAAAAALLDCIGDGQHALAISNLTITINCEHYQT